MKHITATLLSVLIAFVSFTQQTDPVPTLTKEDYLKKSKHQKTAAWILGSSGVVLLGTAFVVAVGEASEDFFGIFAPEVDDGGDASAVIGLVGLAALGSSIPLFIASGRNKRKAMSLSFRNIPSQQMGKNGISYRPLPSFSLKINL